MGWKRDQLDLIQIKLDRIERMLTAVAQGARRIMAELDTLKAEVQNTTNVEQSAIVLLNGLSAQIVALKENPAELQALAETLANKSAELAAAVTANTPGA